MQRLNPALSQYRDRRFGGSDEAFQEALRMSTTLYIGNLSFYTTEEQIYEVFSKAGDVQRIIMGLDKHNKTPCGFCFVVYYTREDAEAAVKYLNGTLVDERNIRVDIDWGFRDGRQFGRGKSGGQVRDEYRVDFDEGRGGFGQIVREEMRRHQAESVRQMDEYNLGQDEAPPSKRRRPSHARARNRDEDSEEEEDD